MKTWLMSLVTTLLAVGCAAQTSRPAARSANFVLTKDPAGPPIVGFGAQLNPYLYAHPNWPAEVNDRNVGDLERKVKDLHPQFVRVFYLNQWWEHDTDAVIAKNHPGMKQSLIRTIRLAQDAGAQILLQFWYDPGKYNNPDDVMGRFVAAIASLRREHGLTSLRFCTVQNEPNDNYKDITPEKYVATYKALDRALKAQHLRDQVQIVSGDLLEVHQETWYKMLGSELASVSDGYSMHAYWDYWDIEKLLRRVRRSAELVHSLPKSQQRPLYTTEFGARGFRDKPGTEPGKSDDGRPVADTPVYAFEIGIYMIEAIRNGYAGTIQWDMVDVWYDRKMGYGVIGTAEHGFPLKPSYHLLSLFTHNVQPGWHAMTVDRHLEAGWEVNDLYAAALASPDNRHHALFLANREEDRTVTIGGLKPRQSFSVQTFDANHSGATESAAPVTTDATGTLKVTLPHEAIVLVKD